MVQESLWKIEEAVRTHGFNNIVETRWHLYDRGARPSRTSLRGPNPFPYLFLSITKVKDTGEIVIGVFLQRLDGEEPELVTNIYTREQADK